MADSGESAGDECHHLFGGEVVARGAGCLRAVEQIRDVARSSTTGSFILPNLVVLTVTGSEIQRFCDFVNILAALEAMGHEL